MMAAAAACPGPGRTGRPRPGWPGRTGWWPARPARPAMLGSTCCTGDAHSGSCRRRARPARSRAPRWPCAEARVTRAKVGMLKMPMAMMALTMPGPNTAVSMMANSMAGKAKVKSAQPHDQFLGPATQGGGQQTQRHAQHQADAHGHQAHGDRCCVPRPGSATAHRAPKASVPSPGLGAGGLQRGVHGPCHRRAPVVSRRRTAAAVAISAPASVQARRASQDLGLVQRGAVASGRGGARSYVARP